MWQKLKTRRLFEHQRLIVDQDDVIMPNGEKSTYLLYRSPVDGVVVICPNNHKEILCVHEYSYPLERVITQLPMGGIHDGENPEDAAKRELIEEVHLRAKTLTSIGSFFQNHRRSTNKAHIYLATDLEEDFSLPADNEEQIGSVWVPESAVDRMIKTGEIVDSDTIGAWMFYRLWQKSHHE
ncbi:NUDIX hydrolase [candidate division WWE3 bacterium]|nr:NUDIX hydrolase [candidate division WWE3 bacterium]